MENWQFKNSSSSDSSIHNSTREFTIFFSKFRRMNSVIFVKIKFTNLHRQKEPEPRMQHNDHRSGQHNDHHNDHHSGHHSHSLSPSYASLPSYLQCLFLLVQLMLIQPKLLSRKAKYIEQKGLLF